MVFKTNRKTGNVFNDERKRSDKHHGSVKPDTGLKVKNIVDYQLTYGGRPIRKATKVEFENGQIVKLDEKLPKKEAIRLAIQHLETHPEYFIPDSEEDINPVKTIKERLELGVGLWFTEEAPKKLEIYYSDDANTLQDFSKHELKEYLDYIDSTIDTSLNSWNLEQIVKNNEIDKNIVELKKQTMSVVDDAIEDSFGYKEILQRPMNEAEKEINKINEFYIKDLRNEDATMHILGNHRKHDYEIVKKLTKKFVTEHLDRLAKILKEYK